jgi:hypothetical protein
MQGISIIIFYFDINIFDTSPFCVTACFPDSESYFAWN